MYENHSTLNKGRDGGKQKFLILEKEVLKTWYLATTTIGLNGILALLAAGTFRQPRRVWLGS